jgi:copper chaperone CopZ
MDRVVMHVRGLEYEHSRVGLARQLTHFPGVARVEVDRAFGTAAIVYDTGLLDERAVVHLIAACGYNCAEGAYCAGTTA